MYDFGPILQRIKAIKAKSGMTNEELSAKSGVAFSTLNKILSGGTTEPKLPSIMAIASALGVSADYLIYGENKPVPDLTAQDADLLRKFHALDPMAQARIMNALNFEYQAAGAVQEDGAKSSRFA